MSGDALTPKSLLVTVERYIAAKDLCRKQQHRLRLHVRKFSAWQQERGKAPEWETGLDRLNAWLSSLAKAHKPATVNGHRQSILALVRFATPDGHALPRVDKVRRQREPEKINPAFTLDEIQQMLIAAPHYEPVTNRVFGRGRAGDTVPRHRPDGVPWSVWWEAFVVVLYHAGQYFSDLRRLCWNEIDNDGLASIIRHKTGRCISFRVPKRAAEAARRIGHRELVLPWQWDTVAYLPREFQKFTRFARVRTLGAKSLRRSAITYCYIQQGEGAARQLAGHASFVTTAKHYIDWSIARRPVVEPPSIDTGCERNSAMFRLCRRMFEDPEGLKEELVNYVTSKGGRVTVEELKQNRFHLRRSCVAERALRWLIENGCGTWKVERTKGRPVTYFCLY